MSYDQAMPVVHTLDLRYLGIPRAIAAFVVFGPPPQSEPVLIETGPASTLAHLIDGLAALSLNLEDIRHALVTHIHLDHAGAAGHLARTGTQIHVHEFGAKHLIDPSKLIDSATRIYGSQMDRLWGPIMPVPEKQIRPVHDGDVICVGGLKFTAIETPGHARHHHAFALDDICFVGDIAGITVPGIAAPPQGKFIAVPTPPPEFDLEAWLASIERLRSFHFRTIYPTHFGQRDNPDAHFQRLSSVVPENAEFVRSRLEIGLDREHILREYIAWIGTQLRNEGISEQDRSRYVSTNLLAMNVDGMIRYRMKKNGA